MEFGSNTSLILNRHEFYSQFQVAKIKFQAALTIAHFKWDSPFLLSPMKDMSGDTSRNLITTRSNGTGVFRHYSTWTAAEQKAAIKACGLSPSKFGNKAQRNAVLFHLEKTLLPTDPGEVLRTLNERNICHLAAKSRQQLSYLLLQHMADGLEVPTTPTPKVTVEPPSADLLKQTARSVLFHRVGANKKPWFYKGSDTLGKLWTTRREAWSAALESLEANGGITTFLHRLADIYVRRTNNVILYNPNKSLVDLRVLIDEEMFKVDETDAPKMFKLAWNNSVALSFPQAVIEGEVVMDEWNWAIPHLVVAVRHAFSAAIRMQFNEDSSDEALVSDQNDEDHAFYNAGVVLYAVKKHFSKQDRIIKTMQNMFVDKETAVK